MVICCDALLYLLDMSVGSRDAMKYQDMSERDSVLNQNYLVLCCDRCAVCLVRCSNVAIYVCFRLGLIGYGVRVQDNVLHHTNPKVACEVLDLTAGDMATSCLMTDDIDEVRGWMLFSAA